MARAESVFGGKPQHSSRGVMTSAPTSPRTRGPRLCRKNWVPASAGTNGGCFRTRQSGFGARLHCRIAETKFLALLELDDLLEAFAEIKLEVVPLRPTEVRRAQHVVHLQVWMVAAGDRLLLVDVHRGVARPAFFQGIEQSTRRDQLGA